MIVCAPFLRHVAVPLVLSGKATNNINAALLGRWKAQKNELLTVKTSLAIMPSERPEIFTRTD